MILFPLGRLMITPAALKRLEVQDGRVLVILKRHMAGDWGDMCDEDRRANDRALEQGTRLLSAYPIDPAHRYGDDNRVWIITEADRSATTILLPEDY